MVIELKSIKESLILQLTLLEALVIKNKLVSLGDREKEYIAIYYICTEGKKIDKNSPEIAKILSKEMGLDKAVVWGFKAKLKNKGWMIQTPSGVELVSYTKLLKLSKVVDFSCKLKVN